MRISDFWWITRSEIITEIDAARDVRKTGVKVRGSSKISSKKDRKIEKRQKSGLGEVKDHDELFKDPFWVGSSIFSKSAWYGLALVAANKPNLCSLVSRLAIFTYV